MKQIDIHIRRDVAKAEQIGNLVKKDYETRLSRDFNPSMSEKDIGKRYCAVKESSMIFIELHLR